MALDVTARADQLSLAGTLDENTKVLFEQLFERAESVRLTDAQTQSLVDMTFRFINAFTFSRTQERLDQKERYLKAKNYYMNRTEEHRVEILSGLFEEKATTQLNSLGQTVTVPEEGVRGKAEALFETIGFTNDVVDELSLMYSEEPERIFLESKTEKVNGEVNDQLISIYDKIGNDKFQRLNELVIATDTPVCRIAWRRDEGVNKNTSRIWIDIRTPDQYEVVVDSQNDTITEAIFFETRDYDSLLDRQNKFTKYQLWTDEFVIGYAIPEERDLNEVSEIKPNELRILDLILNPYKVLPFIPLHSKEPFQDYFVDDNSRRFVSAEEQLSVKQLSDNTGAFSQGFSQPFLKTANPTKYGRLKLGPDQLLMLEKGNPGEQDDEFGYASPSSDINDISQNFASSYSRAAARFGLGTAEGDSTSSASGVSLFISDDKKNKRINNDRPRYNRFEAMLFEIIKKVNNFHVGNLREGEKTDNKTINDDVTLEARFQKIVTPLNNTEQLEKEQFDLDNRLADRVSIIMERNPDITEEQAIASLEAIDERADNPIDNLPVEPVIEE